MGKIKWWGHANFQITTPGGKEIFIDPWFTENPACPTKVEDVGKVDLVLVTHDHFDHRGDAVTLLRRGGQAAGQPEFLAQLEQEGIPGGQLVAMNIGGSVQLQGVTVKMVHAFHSAAYGSPVGWILTMENGIVIYHAGDTGIFADLALWQVLYGVDVALLPIGGVFTMDPDQGAKAVELLRPRVVIPMHYGSFPLLVQEAGGFIRLVKEKTPEVEVVALNPGEEWNF